MGSFDEREAAFEKRFAVAEDARFRARVARDRRVGQWAAHWLGLGEADIEASVSAFAQDCVGKDDSVIAVDLAAGFAAASRPMEPARILRKLAAAQAEADSAEG